MLSYGEKLTEKKRLLSLPEFERPLTVRLKFRKVGSLQYISHLDLQRTFIRVITRACIPVWYTKGFNPHPKLVFSTPLGIGTQSECEFLDIRIDRDMPCEEIAARLNGELTDELRIEDCYIPTKDFSEIGWASYRFEICTEGASSEMAAAIQKTLTESPLLLTKKTKSGEKEVDIVPMIHDAQVRYDAEAKTISIEAMLRASSTEFLNPELVMTGLKQKNGILGTDLSREWYTVVRTALLCEDFSKFS